MGGKKQMNLEACLKLKMALNEDKNHIKKKVDIVLLH